MRHPVANSSLAYEQVGGWGVKEIVSELHAARDAWRAAQQRSLEFAVREFPSREALKEIAESLCGVLFPMRLGPADLHQEGEDFYVGHTLDKALNALFQQVQLELGYNRRLACEEKNDVEALAAEIVKDFARQLPALRGLLDADVEAAYSGDPAARSVDEVLLCYPGILAVIHYRLAHALYALGVPLVARIISEIAHSITGIDIHPGAQIGAGFFIDHGTGVVIGETTVIGRNVRVYQAVTLGAKRFTQDESGALEKGAPRHPILEDEVVVYAGATILGRITIGRGSSIGGNVWLTRSVPAGSHVSQASLQHETGGAGKVVQ
ncbi:serine O-acetyltransferase EpsC [Ferribacterium limneticum]|uniref:serine O-acetyltransferase EpsC n=1 Tax=Ferribacterium limneticum TaxID=76259 RepID=UPI001CFBC2CA|nr:serine O-acetyltransferase EpsC [Ferribacterium limneticum]UCV20123.1 serine acetyltransferase [Ferribacterium limneticum]